MGALWTGYKVVGMLEKDCYGVTTPLPFQFSQQIFNVIQVLLNVTNGRNF